MLDADTQRHRFSQRLVTRVPAGLPAAIEIAARRALTAPAEWTRRALIGALAADGVHLDADGRIATPPPGKD
jgi:hypothetical protein